MAAPVNTPCVLIIRDGWGRNPNAAHDSFNAVKLAQTPIADMLEADWPTTLIRTSGEDVGLPDGTMGNSEVGHQNIGAGRIVAQDSVRISQSIRDGSFFKNGPLVAAIQAAKETNNAVHIMGLASDAGVHSRLDHLYACVQLCKQLGQQRVFIHCFTDGRDTGPFTGKGFLEDVEHTCSHIGVGKIASVMGRYYAMDRDNRWERVQLAYGCLTGRSENSNNAPSAHTAAEAAQCYYDAPTGKSMAGDEFITPTIIAGSPAHAEETRITDGDTVIFFNYRGDRPREITRAFVLPEFEGHVKPSPDSGKQGFARGPRLSLNYVTMTSYEEALAPYVHIAFPKPPKLANIMGAHLSAQNLTQFRCAETEKFPHVTFFFNDYRDEPFAGESREIIQSPRVATYDQQPEMSAAGVLNAVLERLADKDCESFIVVNFANPDMVGHTGSLEAAIHACQTVDACVGKIMNATLARAGSLIITADHGNAEQLWNPETGSPHTAHTTYDVPLHVVGERFQGRSLRESGRLADLAPTALDMMGLPRPPEMTGESLLASP